MQSCVPHFVFGPARRYMNAESNNQLKRIANAERCIIKTVKFRQKVSESWKFQCEFKDLLDARNSMELLRLSGSENSDCSTWYQKQELLTDGCLC